ncbi:MAG TPA: hypothetical protein PLO37_00510 [Candidatus Hydrogenedentes bacterium]|nr:hypothetical protein [Candidatus Hydrogenedentota bacterium]HPG65295.1 hypothetical protein [Candidatus Hydrogenedentota bacterium]
MNRPVSILHGSAAARRDGFVLICVLWVLAILTVVALGFGQRAMLDARAAAYSLAYTKAMYLARGAVERGIAEIRDINVINWFYQEEGGTGLGQHWAHPTDMFVEGVYYNASDYEGETCAYCIEDEERRISINAADEELLCNIEVGGDTVFRRTDARKLIKHRTGDPDEEEPPHRFQNTEELRYLFREFEDDEFWCGVGDTPGVRDLITCWGGGRINVNTASAEVLECIPGLDKHDDTVARILGFRAGLDGEIGTEDDLAFNSIDAIGIVFEDMKGDSLDALNRYCTTTSDYFTITGIATLHQGKVRAICKATVLGPNVLDWREDPIGS